MILDQQHFVTSMEIKSDQSIIRESVNRMNFNKVMDFMVVNTGLNDPTCPLVMIGLIKIILSNPSSNITTLFKSNIIKYFIK